MDLEKTKNNRIVKLWFALLVLGLGQAFGGQLLVDFEEFTDSTELTDQLSGLTFVNTVVLTTTGNLNEFDFPPFSGVAVATDVGGPIEIKFNLGKLGASSIFAIRAYVTYVTPLLFEALGPGDSVLGSVTSTFSENFGSSGNPPNELLELSASGILGVRITGDLNGESFVLDDLTLDFEPGSSFVPEPQVWTCVGIGLLAIGAARRRALASRRLG